MARDPIEVQSYLKGIKYPASKKDIIDTAQKNMANETAMDTIRRLPDKPYLSPAHVTKEVMR
ncbi:MAG TPA: DUF2795 domain-containing protein [Candidatus Nanoarchaeia archaeon]|nr:DUF2795 domain-containing protein [Candidatus Nanoarchaeia archaeon]